VCLQELYVNPEDEEARVAEQGAGLLEVAAYLGVRLLQEGPTPGTLALDPKALWHVIDSLRRSGAQALGISTARVVTELVEADTQPPSGDSVVLEKNEGAGGVNERACEEEHLVPRS
jgi:sugar phosphate isomerase/epimerase